MVVKRRFVHAAFGVAVLVFAGLTTFEGVKVHQAKAANAALARALAIHDDYERALKAYKTLGRDASPPLAAAALYNAGNLQLREALKEGPDAAVRALPLIELAKQNYRAVLRLDPDDWDARYNLERALWLAPEVEEEAGPKVRRDAENRVMSTLQSTRADLP
jgi:mxaK protein